MRRLEGLIVCLVTLATECLQGEHQQVVYAGRMGQMATLTIPRCRRVAIAFFQPRLQLGVTDQAELRALCQKQGIQL